jgi:lysophospholipase L1-like esterase
MSAPSRPPRRNIRLKEWPPSLDSEQRPSAEYLAAADGTLVDRLYRLRTNDDGYIVGPAGPDAAFDETLLFLGDSFVESVFVDEGARFPAAVEARLRAAGRQVRCLNGGYSGATTLHLLLALLAKVGRAAQTQVCLVVPSNDALALAKRGGYWALRDKRYAPIVPVPEGSDAGHQPVDAADLRVLLGLFVDTCRRLRLPLTLATFPHRTATFAADPWLQRRFGAEAGYNRVLVPRRQLNDVVRAVAARMNLPLIDLDAAISARTDLFYDDLHMNASGSALVADLVATAYAAAPRRTAQEA